MSTLYNKLNLEVARFASKTVIKPEFASVLFMDGKTVATDSARLVEITTPRRANENIEDYPTSVGHGEMITKIPEPFMLAAAQIKNLKIAKPSKTLPVLNTVALFRESDKSAIELVSTNIEDKNAVEIRPTEGTFPDYEQVFPKGAPAFEVLINGEYLAEILDTLSKLNNSKQVTIKFFEDKKPLLIEASNDDQSARALLMPCKI